MSSQIVIEEIARKSVAFLQPIVAATYPKTNKPIRRSVPADARFITQFCPNVIKFAEKNTSDKLLIKFVTLSTSLNSYRKRLHSTDSTHWSNHKILSLPFLKWNRFSRIYFKFITALYYDSHRLDTSKLFVMSLNTSNELNNINATANASIFSTVEILKGNLAIWVLFT